MSKILILGSSGNLGGVLVNQFKNKHKVVGWDKDEIDITDKDLVINKIEEIKPDVIINSAAYNAVDKCEEDDVEYEKAKKINSDAVGFLAEAALSTGAVLVHFSSDYVFDGEKEDGYTEKDVPNPINKYAKTKRMGEDEIIKRSGEGLKWYLVRISKLFGQMAESENSKESFFDLILRLSKERKEFNMVDGEEISCFTYAPDLAGEIQKIIEEKKPFGIYHVANSEAASWYDAAKYMFELKGIDDVKLNPSKSEDYPRPAKRPRHSILLNTKLEPLRSWKEALREYFDKD